MKLATNRWHDITPGRWVYISHSRVALIDRSRLPLLFQEKLLGKRPIRKLPAVRAQWRAGAVSQPGEWPETRMRPKPFLA